MAGQRECFEQELTCNLCLELYSQPKSLPCLHSYCKCCLREYIDSRTTRLFVAANGAFRCPICRALTRPPERGLDLSLWADSFPDNWTLKNLIGTLDRREKPPPSQAEETCCRHQAYEFYCFKCESLACGVCSATRHSGCEERLKQLHLALSSTRRMAQAYLATFDLQSSSAASARRVVGRLLDAAALKRDRLREEIVGVKTKMMDALLRQEESLLDELEGHYDLEADRLKSLLGECDSQVESLAGRRKLVSDVLASERSPARFFALWRTASLGPTDLNEGAEMISRVNSSPCSLHFKTSEEVGGYLSNNNFSLGVLTKSSSSSGTEAPRVNETLFCFSSKPTLKLSFSTAVCRNESPCIWGLCVCPDGYIAVSDCDNKRVKLFTGAGELHDHLLLSSPPYGLSLLPGGAIVVTEPDDRTLTFLGRENVLKITGQAKTPKPYISVAALPGEGRLVCCSSSSSPASVDIITLGGDLIRSVAAGGDRREVFGEPEYIAVNSEEVLVADWEKKTLFCCDLDGNVRSAFTGDLGRTQLVCPLGVCLDSFGFVYLADRERSAVYKFRPDKIFDSFVLSGSDGLDRPVALAMDSDQQLVVAECKGFVKVFV